MGRHQARVLVADTPSRKARRSGGSAYNLRSSQTRCSTVRAAIPRPQCTVWATRIAAKKGVRTRGSVLEDNEGSVGDVRTGRFSQGAARCPLLPAPPGGVLTMLPVCGRRHA
jgi:hypothetical protein